MKDIPVRSVLSFLFDDDFDPSALTVFCWFLGGEVMLVRFGG